MKKLFALVLSLCLLMSLVPMNAMADDMITLRVEVYDRSIAGFDVENSWQMRYAQENFGDPNGIKLEFVPVSRWEEGTLINTMLAGGTAPDLCMTYGTGMLEQYIDMGGLYPLDDLLEQYGQNLVAFLGDEVLEYGQYDVGNGPEQFFLPARRIITSTVVYYIRGDWLEKLGMEVPQSPEALYEYLKAAKEQNLGGEMTIPYSADVYEPDPFNGTAQVDAYIKWDEVSEEDWFAYADFHYMLPGAREAYRELNKYYNEGLLTEGFGLGDSDAIDSARHQGFDGFWSQNWDAGYRADFGYSQELAKSVPGAYWVACNPYYNMYGERMNEGYNANGQGLFIPITASEEAAVAAIKYLDWMAQPENMFVMQNGLEGIHYTTVNEDGIPTDIKGIDAVPDEYKMHATDIVPISNGMNYGSEELNIAAQTLSYEPQFRDAVANSLTVARDGEYAPPTFTVPIVAEADYGSFVTAKEAELLTQAVTCKPDEFDAKWDEYLKAVLEVGAQEIIDEQRQAYQDGNIRGAYPYADKQQ